MASKPEPPHDCRLTHRFLEDQNFSVPLARDFDSLRNESTLVDHFFERRRNDPAGGEGGDRVSQIRSRPAYKFTSGRMRGATWFDTAHPPQGIVWLLGAELHDERHKGTRDAYDILGNLDESGELWPQPIDYKRLELDRRRWDTDNFAADVQHDGEQLIASAWPGRARGTVASVPVRAIAESEEGFGTIYVAISERQVKGARSRASFPLTEKRFWLVLEGLREAAERVLGVEVLADELRNRKQFPGELKQERPGILFFEAPSGS